MGTETKPGTRVQAWVPHELAWELKAHADSERLSVSAVIRLALEDRLVGASRRGRRRARARRRRGEVRDRWLRSGFHIAIGDPWRKAARQPPGRTRDAARRGGGTAPSRRRGRAGVGRTEDRNAGQLACFTGAGLSLSGHATDFPSARACVVQIPSSRRCFETRRCGLHPPPAAGYLGGRCRGRTWS
jgi:hypothetical protein